MNNYNKWAESTDSSSYHGKTTGNSSLGSPSPVLVDKSGNAISNSEVYLQNRNAGYASGLTDNSSKGLSDYRQEQIRELSTRKDNNPRANIIAQTVSKESLLKKEASGGNSGGSVNGQGTTTHIAPDLYSPLFLTQNLQLPRDRVTANAWNRAFYETNPFVRNAINLHATYPISKLSIKCEDKKKEGFYLDMANKINLESVVQSVALEWWKLGEAFVYANFDESSGTWDKLYLHNPDFISVKSSIIPGVSSISLRPDRELEKIVSSNDPQYAKIREKLDKKVIDHVLRGEYIPLDSFNISHLKDLSAPYDVRGTSIIVSTWKDLMLYDKLRESKFVQADAMINPLTLVKIGSSNPDGFYPNQDDLDAWRQTIEQSQYDRNFSIVTHPDVSIERVGFSGSVIDTNADFSLIIDNVLMGLMVPKAIITQEGASYASASVGLDVLRQRYNSFRNMMSNWLIKKIFAPIAEVNDFYRYEAGRKTLVLPEIEWNHMTLHDVDSYIGHLMNLYDKTPRAVSKKTIFRSLGLNVNDENENIREETVKEMLLDKEAEILRGKTTSELRSIDPKRPFIEEESDVTSSINEPQFSPPPLPGAAPPVYNDGEGGF